MKNEIVCYADSSRGIFIPQYFAETCADGWNLKPEDREILLAGPEHDLYRDVWEDVLSYAEHTDEAGVVWRLYQDGDLFAYTGEFPDDIL